MEKDHFKHYLRKGGEIGVDLQFIIYDTNDPLSK